MISLEEIKEEITKLESATGSFENCHRLATLYILYDRLSSQKSAGAARQSEKNELLNVGAVLAARGNISVDGHSSEFLHIVNGKNPGTVWPVLDELMGTLKIINPRLYAGVIRRLEE